MGSFYGFHPGLVRLTIAHPNGRLIPYSPLHTFHSSVVAAVLHLNPLYDGITLSSLGSAPAKCLSPGGVESKPPCSNARVYQYLATKSLDTREYQVHLLQGWRRKALSTRWSIVLLWGVVVSHWGVGNRSGGLCSQLQLDRLAKYSIFYRSGSGL